MIDTLDLRRLLRTGTERAPRRVRQGLLRRLEPALGTEYTKTGLQPLPFCKAHCVRHKPLRDSSSDVGLRRAAKTLEPRAHRPAYVAAQQIAHSKFGTRTRRRRDQAKMAECAARFRSRANADSIGALLHPGTESERQAALRRKGRPARDHARENVLAIRRAEKENRQRKEEAANAVKKPYKMKQFRNVRMRRL